jgi:hypothetical protein
MVFCGWDEVFIADPGDFDGDNLSKIWSWRAEDCRDLPEDFRTLFNTTDECKPIDGGRRILISSSGGGLAVVDRSSGRVQWYGYLGNAHSIELLPQKRVVAAGSTHPRGNKLALFDLSTSNQILFETELYSGHGVVWDETHRLLWALGYEELRAYSLKDWHTRKPKLKLEQTYRLPSTGGHDLIMSRKGLELLLTTNDGVYSFEIKKSKFSPYPQLAGLERIKSVSIHPLSQQVAYIQAEGQNWWSTRVRLLNPSGELRLGNERLYKVRWIDSESAQIR